MSERPTVAELLDRPGALLTTTDLAALGLPRKAIEAVLRSVEPIYLPGYRRPLVRREDYLELVERSQHRGDRGTARLSHNPYVPDRPAPEGGR